MSFEIHSSPPREIHPAFSSIPLVARSGGPCGISLVTIGHRYGQLCRRSSLCRSSLRCTSSGRTRIGSEKRLVPLTLITLFRKKA